MFLNTIKRISLWIGLFLPIITMAASKEVVALNEHLYDDYPWMLTYYYGNTYYDPLVRVVTFHNLNRWPEYLQSIELMHTLDKQNILRHLVSPIVGVVQFGAVFALRDGKKEPPIYELDPYFAFRWTGLPWNQYVLTSVAIGEGISYVTSVPYAERRNNNHTKRLLNFLMLEASFALPEHPRWQLVVRVHHRSGAFGLYGAGNTGSNNVGLAIRYLF